MKIVMCTPLSAESAIGKVAVKTSEELARRGHSVSLVNIEHEQSKRIHSTSLAISDWNDRKALAQFQSADVIVVQIGDNYQYHAGAIDILRNWRCVGVFHDANIYNLFRMWAFDGRTEAEGQLFHDHEISRCYGSGDTGIISCESGANAIGALDMLEWLAAYCCAALAHSDFYKPAIEKACPGNVVSTPLTYDTAALTETDSAITNSGFAILTVGHVNPNKCCDLVIKAIGQSSILSHAEYRIAGPITDLERSRLTSLAAKSGMHLVLLGQVADDVLAQEYKRANVVSCLRRPILEGASASAIEALLLEKCTIVVNAGFYADIDDGAVVKLSPEFTENEVANVLDRLAEDPEFRNRVASCGRKWAETNCGIETYVDVLEMLLRDATAIAPYLELSKTYAEQLSSLGLKGNDQLFLQVADTLQDFCGSK